MYEEKKDRGSNSADNTTKSKGGDIHVVDKHSKKDRSFGHQEGNIIDR